VKLRVMLPTRIAFDHEVDKVVAEGPQGFFGLLPRHVDTVSELVPGIVTYSADGREGFVAVDGGTLVKLGPDVLVVTATAAVGDDLERLRAVVEETMERAVSGRGRPYRPGPPGDRHRPASGGDGGATKWLIVTRAVSSSLWVAKPGARSRAGRA
jgi:F-type H+-transporting ATPase subunit epsilon